MRVRSVSQWPVLTQRTLSTNVNGRSLNVSPKYFAPVRQNWPGRSDSPPAPGASAMLKMRSHSLL